MNDDPDDDAITDATPSDVDAIASLLQANAPSRGGTLTGEFPPAKVAQMLSSGSPVLVARRADRIVGVLVTSPVENAEAPVVHAMLAAWPGEPGAYVYGPVCVAESERGRGLLARLYAALRQRLPGREAVLFVRADNAASLRAHERLGMHVVARFDFGGAEHVVMSDRAR